MKSLPKSGTLGEVRFVVEPRHAIDFAEGGMPAVLSTPWLMPTLRRCPSETEKKEKEKEKMPGI